MVKIHVDYEKCTGCGSCTSICPVGVYELQPVSSAVKSIPVNADQCIACRACEVQCPSSAITIQD